MSTFKTRMRQSLARLAIGAAVASFAMVGLAKADNDGISNTNSVPVTGTFFNCSSEPVPAGSGAKWVPSAFSFDISFVDPFVRGYFLADRSNSTAPNVGDIGFIDLDASPTLTYTHWDPPANDPMAGAACDQNTAFGGTNGVGRNEITGPNGVITVNHSEVWVGDGPSKFQPGQFDGTATTTGGVTTFSGTAQDYANDPCDSSVRVFDIATHQQTDHINLGGCFRTDEGAWDPDDQIAIFANPTEQPIPASSLPLNQIGFVSLISTKPVPFNPRAVPPQNAHSILAQINFDGKHGTVRADAGIEQSVYARSTGLFYIAIPGTNAAPNDGYVTVLNPREMRVVNNFRLKNCAPNGAALGPDDELILGCGAGPEQVIDIRTGKVVKVIAGTSGGCDEVYFNAGDDHFAGACTDSNKDGSDNLDISDADSVKFDQAADTYTKGAHSVASDPVTVTDFVPAAAGAGATPDVNPKGLCGPTPCVLLFSSLGGDDPSAHFQEAAEDGKRNPKDQK